MVLLYEPSAQFVHSLSDVRGVVDDGPYFPRLSECNNHYISGVFNHTATWPGTIHEIIHNSRDGFQK
jgi:hypothetical protein